MVQFEWFGHYSLISTIVNPSKKKRFNSKFISKFNIRINKEFIGKKKLENETHANRVEA